MFNSFRFAALALIPFTMVACAATPDAQSDETASEELVSKTAHFETFQGIDGQYYFDVVADNGQNVLRSEGYKTAAGMQNGIASVVSNGVDLASFQVSEASDGEYYFNLVAPNNEVIGTSQLYSTKSNATRGTKAVQTLLSHTGATPRSTPAPKLQRFEVFQGEDRQYYFHLRAGNGEIVLTSEGYTTKASALSGVSSVQTNGGTAASYDVFATADGQYAIRLKAANDETIAQGEAYVSKSNATRAVTRLAQILATPISIEQ
jgi:uncharacterized protein YegP (UPF0339 family)